MFKQHQQSGTLLGD